VVIDRNGRLIYSDSGFKIKEIINAIESGLKTSKIDEVYVEKKKPKTYYRTRYQKLRENKGYD